jgi:hypothetical protein
MICWCVPWRGAPQPSAPARACRCRCPAHPVHPRAARQSEIRLVLEFIHTDLEKVVLAHKNSEKEISLGDIKVPTCLHPSFPAPLPSLPPSAPAPGAPARAHTHTKTGGALSAAPGRPTCGCCSRACRRVTKTSCYTATSSRGTFSSVPAPRPPPSALMLSWRINTPFPPERSDPLLSPSVQPAQTPVTS